MQVKPYLNFEGRCDEALAFYRDALGAEVTSLMRYRDHPQPTPSDDCPGGAVSPDKVMHASLRIGATEVFASDGMCKGEPSFQGVSLAIDPGSVAEAERMFGALGEGGQVQMPLGPTFFAKSFGMVTDRFGVPWLLVVAA